MKKPLILTIVTIALAAFAAGAQESTDTLEQAVVTGTRVAVSRDLLPVPVSIVGRRTLEASDENNILPVLMEQVPGLFVTTRGVTGFSVSNGAAGAISVRGFGAADGRVLVLIDGHPQFEALYGHPVGDEYIAADAERIEVSRGASSVLYGSNAMGGAINIITRKHTVDGNRLNVKLMGGSYGTYRGSATDSYRNGRFSGTASINYDRTAGHRTNSAFNSLSGMLKAGYEISDNWNVSANIDLVKSYSENPGPVSAPILEGTADILRGMSGLSFENRYDRMKGALNFYYNAGNHIINDGHVASKPSQQYLFHGFDYMAGANLYEAFDIFSGNTLTAGIDAKFYGGDAYRNPVTEYYADHVNLREFAGYLFDQYNIGKFALNLGVRVEHHSVYGIEWAPQAGIAFSPAAGTSFKLSAAKGFRAPNIKEMYMFPASTEEILPEEAWSYDFTASHNFFDGALKAELGLYYTTGSNLIANVMIDGIRKFRNVGAFANKGVEFSAVWTPARNLSFNANYSFLHMDTIYTGAPRHKLYVGGNWRPGRWDLNLGAMGIAGLYLNTAATPAISNYVDLKARVGFKLSDAIQIFVKGENLLNQAYETMEGFPMPGICGFAGLTLSL